MFHCFYPTYDAKNVYGIDFERVYEKGYRGLIFDIDNTLVGHDAPADAMARNLLIEPRAYRDFVASGAYHAAGEVERFAQSQHVQKYIVMGRLMKEERIPWGARPRYEWA